MESQQWKINWIKYRNIKSSCIRMALFIVCAIGILQIDMYAQELLEVESGITISESISETPQTGTIRWNSTKQTFQGYIGNIWVDLNEPGGWGKPIFDYTSETERINNDTINEFGKIIDMGSLGRWIVVGDDNNRKVHFVNSNNGNVQTRSRPNVPGFGEHVSIDSITATVGTFNDELFVFERNPNGTWELLEKLTSATGGDLEAYADVHGRHIVAETSTTDLISYVKNNGIWSQQFSSISASNGADLVRPRLHNDRLLATDDDRRGSGFYVFEHDQASWRQIAYLVPSTGDSINASTLSIFDNRVLGCDQDSGNCYLFTQTDSGWSESILTPIVDGTTRTQIISATMSKDYVVIGDSFCTSYSNICNSGLLFVFHNNGAEWGQQIILTASEDGTFLGFRNIAMTNRKIASASWRNGIFIFRR